MWVLLTARGQQLAIPTLPAVLGSGPAADVRVPHDSVLAEHARLSEGSAGTLRVEALGDGPIAAAGQRVERALLRDGDELVLGRIRFTLHASAERATASSAASLAASSAASSAAASAAASAASPAASPSVPPAASQRVSPSLPRGVSPAPPRPLSAAAGRAATPRAAAEADAGVELTQRKRTLQFSKVEARRGLLAADLSQLPAGQRWALVLGALLLAAALAAGIAFAFGLLG
jgi:hypothetical protein